MTKRLIDVASEATTLDEQADEIANWTRHSLELISGLDPEHGR